jgi:cysteine desulfurase
MKKSKIIYMDHASSSLSSGANPSAIHDMGMREKSKLENARKKIAGILGVSSKEVFFTSGATESNNLAILGLVHTCELFNFFGPRVAHSDISEKNELNQTLKNLKAHKNKEKNIKPHIITTNIEHSSVLEVCKYLERTNRAEVSFVEVEENGIVDPKKIKKEIKKNTILVSVGYANNEIGIIMPLREIAKEIRYFRKTQKTKFPYFHTDAVQAMNYLPLQVEKLGVDMLSFNGAKINGPKGVGVLVVRKNIELSPIMFGGSQEMGLRPGTENVSSIELLAKALEKTEKEKDKEVKRISSLQKYFINKIKKINKNILINGDVENRLPNNINITIPNIPSDLLVVELSARGIMVSAKSACKAGDGKASYVISAINKNTKETDGSLRFSLGKENNKENIDFVVSSLKDILKKLARWYN